MPTAPLTRDVIKTRWIAQNPALVTALESNGMLPTRLTESLATAKSVQADAVARGLSPEQARELANDAIGLPVTEETD